MADAPRFWVRRRLTPHFDHGPNGGFFFTGRDDVVFDVMEFTPDGEPQVRETHADEREAERRATKLDYQHRKQLEQLRQHQIRRAAERSRGSHGGSGMAANDETRERYMGAVNEITDAVGHGRAALDALERALNMCSAELESSNQPTADDALGQLQSSKDDLDQLLGKLVNANQLIDDLAAQV